MTVAYREEIPPGEILLEDHMKPLGVTARQLAADMDVPPSRISDRVIGLHQGVATLMAKSGQM